jgi:hypothetical protein
MNTKRVLLTGIAVVAALGAGVFGKQGSAERSRQTGGP